MIDPKTGAPTEAEPSVTIAGRVLIMRNGVLSAYELSEMRLDPNSIFSINDTERKVVLFSHIMKLFRAVVAHNYVSQRERVPSVEEFLLMIEAEPEEAKQKLASEISAKVMEVVYPKLWTLTQNLKLRESTSTAGAERTN